MSKTNLNKITVRELLGKIGTVVKPEQLENIVKHRGAFLELLAESKIKLENIDIYDFLIQNSCEVNKEKLIYYSYLNLKKYINYLKVESKGKLASLGVLELEAAQKYYKNCEEFLKDAKFEIPIIEKDSNGITHIKEIKTSDELIHNKKRKDEELKQNNLNRLKEIEEDIDVDELLTIGSLDDYEEFIALYKHNGPDFKFVVLNNFERKLEMFLNEKITDDVVPSKDEVNKFKFSTILNESKNIINEFPDKIDIDKLLLISAYRAKKMIEENCSDSEVFFLTEIMQVAYKHIENTKCKINGEIQVNVDDDIQSVDYSFKKLEQDISQIADGKYYSNYKIIETKKSILNGEIDFNSGITKELLNLVNLNAREKNELINLNPDNFQYLAILDYLSKDEIKDILKENAERIKLDTLFTDFMYNNGTINKEDIINLYMKNNISFSAIVNIDVIDEIKNQITEEDLIKYYFEMKEDNEKTINFDRYALIFKEFKLKGKNPEEVKQISNRIMEELYKRDSEYETDLKKLYKENIFPIDSLVEWNGEETVYELIKDNILKPKDAKDLFLKGELDLEKAYNTLKKSSLSDTEKMNFIMSSFDGNGNNDKEIAMQNEARMYLMQSLNISRQISNSELNSGTLRKNNTGSGAKANRYVTNPVYRWQLMSSIDENYTSEVYCDGYVKFYLPNVKNGTVVLEKLYRRTKDGVVINYGSATYFLSEEDYINHRHEFEEDNKINTTNLLNLTKKSKESYKKSHAGSWGAKMVKELGVSMQNGYDEEKVKKIDEIAKKVDESKELMK